MAAPEQPRVSLQSITLQRLESTSRPLQPVNRLVIVGSADAPAASIADWFEQRVHMRGGDVADGDMSSLVTGLLLMFPTGWIHIIEGSLPSLSLLIREMLKELDTAAGAFRAVKVVSCMDDIPARSMSRWQHNEVAVQRGNYAEVDADSLPGLLADTVIGMIKVCRSLDQITKEEAAIALADWHKAYADFMPSNERCAQLLELDECPPLADFAAVFETPTEVSLTSDKVWPSDRPLIY